MISYIADPVFSFDPTPAYSLDVTFLYYLFTAGVISYIADPVFSFDHTPAYSLDVTVNDGTSDSQMETLTVAIIDVQDPVVGITNLPDTAFILEDTVTTGIVFQVGNYSA